MSLFVVAALISFGAMLIRGLTGFGAALVMAPLLLLFFDSKTAVVATAFIQFLTGCQIALQSRRHIDRRYLLQLLPVSLAGIVIGSWVLLQMDSSLLKRALGVAVMLFALRMMLALRREARAGTAWPAPLGYAAGLLSGLLGTLFGLTGPPVVIYLEHQIAAKDVLRATLIAYFLLVDGVRLISYTFAQLVTFQTLQLSLVMLPTALLGGHIGARLNGRIGERAFRWLVSSIVLSTGALLALGR